MVHDAHAVLLEHFAERGVSPVCVLDIPRKGGATYYSLRRMEEYLAHGRGVVRLTCNEDGTLEGTAHYRDISAAFRLPGVHALCEPPMPRFHTVLVNELVSWTLPLEARPRYEPLGTGSPRWIPAILRIIMEYAAFWDARLEVVTHDYFPVCPNFVLLNDPDQRHYCGVPGTAGCAACLAQPFMRTAFGESFSITAWRAAWDAFLAQANRITCPSQSVRDILLRAFDANGKRTAVIPHEPLMRATAKLVLPDKECPMHIAVAGRITVPKGAAIVRDLALLMREKGTDGLITVVGTMAAPGIALPENVRVTGPYAKGKLGETLCDIGATVGFISSVWPETFNYVCQELMQLGLPLVCFDLGAPAERVRAWEHGGIAKAVSAEAALEALQTLDFHHRQINN